MRVNSIRKKQYLAQNVCDLHSKKSTNTRTLTRWYEQKVKDCSYLHKKMAHSGIAVEHLLEELFNASSR